MPPQHGKSMLITQTYPSYYFLKNPNKKTIIISYGDDLARLFGRKNKEKIKEFLNSLPEKNKQQAREKLKSKFPNLDKQKLKEYKSITN